MRTESADQFLCLADVEVAKKLEAAQRRQDYARMSEIPTSGAVTENGR